MVFQVVNNPADFQWHPQVRHVSPMTHHTGADSRVGAGAVGSQTGCPPRAVKSGQGAVQMATVSIIQNIQAFYIGQLSTAVVPARGKSSRDWDRLVSDRGHAKVMWRYTWKSGWFIHNLAEFRCVVGYPKNRWICQRISAIYPIPADFRTARCRCTRAGSTGT